MLWEELQANLHDGRLENDDNLLKNAIKPVALGRKNWLIAGSHDAAQNIAMYRSFFGTCHLNGVIPYDWLRYVLENVRSTTADLYHTLLPNLIDPSLLKQYANYAATKGSSRWHLHMVGRTRINSKVNILQVRARSFRSRDRF